MTAKPDPPSNELPAPAVEGNASYWTESRRPLTSLVFISPLLLAYELGVLILGPQAIRNGADAWLRQLLEAIGFGQYFLLPVLTVCILLGWHYTTRQPWRVTPGVLAGMAIECVCLAAVLRLILQLQGGLLQAITYPVESTVPTLALAMDLPDRFRGLVGFLGAGVYEELLFRLILLSLVVAIVRRLGGTPRKSLVAVVLATSFVFAMAHYVGPNGEPLHLQASSFWFSFLFRFLAGLFFGTLFVYRGFGIAAGAHAGYDILVGLF
jgi:membrane protease YdiL (CAAX protease family)